jgi:hypothetical protein
LVDVVGIDLFSGMNCAFRVFRATKPLFEFRAIDAFKK